MRRLRSATSALRRVLGFGRYHYQQALGGDSGQYVMADLRVFCQCKPPQLDWEHLERELRSDPDAYKEHMARARVYFRMRGFLDLTDAQIDAAEENIEEMGGGIDG